MTIVAAAAALLLIASVPALTTAYARLLPFEAAQVGFDYYVPTVSKAATAAASDSSDEGVTAAAYLKDQPTAVWLTPEANPLETVAADVAALAADARSQDATLVLVVYGLPDRDCGNFSAGGLEPGDYDTWTTSIGDAVRAEEGTPFVLIVEPDSIALAPDCDGMTERFANIATAVENLQARNAWLYLDGGHSNWRPAAEMAQLIEQVGVNHIIRGVVTNVSNFNFDGDEVDYAHALSQELGGLHAVIDTGRNGAGANGEWCNPSGRLVGAVSGTFGDAVIDANLWIKPPGESDGTCNGGPTAGHWWPAAAVELTRDVAN